MPPSFGGPPLLAPDDDVPLDPEVVSPLEDVVVPDDNPEDDADEVDEPEDSDRTSWSTAPLQASAIEATEPAKRRRGESRMRPS